MKVTPSLCAISIVVLEWISKVQSEYVKDPETRSQLKKLKTKKKQNPNIHGKKTYHGANKEYIYPVHQYSKLKS